MRAFLLNKTIKDVVSRLKITNRRLVLIDKSNFPEKTIIGGEKKYFENFFWQLLVKAEASYGENCPNKIILISGRVNNKGKITLNITDGARLQRPAILREKSLRNELADSIFLIKNKFSGKLTIITNHKFGKTVSCLFPTCH